MTPGTPQLHLCLPPLREHVDYIGYWERGGTQPHRSTALPRGAATVIIDIGGGDHIDFFAADAGTRIPVAPAFIAGAGNLSYVTSINPGQTVMTIHFRPGGAAAFLGIPLRDLTDTCVDLTDVWGREGGVLRERLTEIPSPAGRITMVEDFLLARLNPGPNVLRPVLTAAEQQPGLRVSDAAAMTGLSPKRLISAFRNDIGLTPKAYLRVRRLQAAVRLLDAGDADGAAIAARVGYFDQAHLIREFRSFAAMTPTRYVQNRDQLPGHIGLAR